MNTIINWVSTDYRSDPRRFVVENFAWSLSIGAAVLFALTVPYVPFIPYLCATITGCALYAWSAWTRGSFGGLGNYALLTAIDTIGLVRLIIDRI